MSDNREQNRRWFVRAMGGVVLAGAGTTGGVIAARRMSDRRGNDRDKIGPYYEEKPVDPKLVRYRIERKVSPTTRAPRAIALDGMGRLTVAGGTSAQFDANGDSASTMFETRGAATAVAIDARRQTWVATNHEVAVFDAQAKRLRSWPLPIAAGIVTSIAVGEPGVFLADARNRVVAHCDREGKLIKRIGDKGGEKGSPGFILPSPYFDLDIGADGLLWVTNPGRHRMEAYTFEGQFETAWGKAGMAIESFCGCCNPVNFARLPDGRFVTAEKGIPRVKIYRADGAFDCVVAESSVFDSALRCDDALHCRGKGLDVAADSDGRIYVLDQVSGAVCLFTEKAKV